MNKFDVIIGIDPGISGAVCIMDLKTDEVFLFDVPTMKVEQPRKKQKKTEYDKIGMKNILEPYAKRKVMVSLEQVHAMPNQGVTSMFSFGRGLGLWEGILAAFNWEPDMVTPQTWKKEFGDRLLKKVDKPDILKTIKKADYNRASVADRAKYDAAQKQWDSDKKQSKNLAKQNAVTLAIELYPSVEQYLQRKKDSDRAEALLIAERLRRKLDAEG